VKLILDKQDVLYILTIQLWSQKLGILKDISRGDEALSDFDRRQKKLNWVLNVYVLYSQQWNPWDTKIQMSEHRAYCSITHVRLDRAPLFPSSISAFMLKLTWILSLRKKSM